MEQNKVIRMRNITKCYKIGNEKVQVLNNVTFEISKGEFVAILGPSGSGKSTLMNILGCIDTADEGIYILDNEELKDKSDNEYAHIRNNKIGFVFQKFNLIPKYSALYNVAMPLLIRGESRISAFDRAEKMLTKVGLSDRMHHKPIELSGGQQQRVAVARALVGNTNILLADEPTGNLDSKTSEEIINLFIELNHQGNTIILITHDLNVAKKAKRIIHVKDGQVS